MQKQSATTKTKGKPRKANGANGKAKPEPTIEQQREELRRDLAEVLAKSQRLNVLDPPKVPPAARSPRKRTKTSPSCSSPRPSARCCNGGTSVSSAKASARPSAT